MRKLVSRGLVAVFGLHVTFVGGAMEASAQTTVQPSIAPELPPLRAQEQTESKLLAEPVSQLSEGAAAERPWAVGVAPEAQARARQLFTEGTEFLLRSLEEQAIAKYDEALEHWDHPGIHYNYAVALSTRDRPLETRKHLLEALRYGEQGPLEPLEVEQARRYLTLVEASLAFIDVSTAQSGVTVRMNGRVILTKPGRYRGYVQPDEYIITGSKPDYLTREQRVAFLPGRENKVEVRLYTEQELTRYQRRWPAAGPIAVTAVGALVGVAGGAMWVIASNEIDEYDSRVRAACPRGCSGDDDRVTSLESLKRSGERLNTLALPLAVGGGVTLAVGAVLLYLNRAETYQVNPAELDEAAGGEKQSTGRWSVLPVIGPSMGMMVGGTRF